MKFVNSFITHLSQTISCAAVCLC